MTLPDKKMMYGKAVFDFLLLPGSGKLLVQQAPKVAPPLNSEGTQGDPSAFVLGSSAADMFSAYDDTNAAQFDDRVYTWAHVEDLGNNVGNDVPFQEETRSKKDLPDLDMIRQQRELDLRGENHLNTSMIPPPTTTRI
jgi:hypothetical protein